MERDGLRRRGHQPDLLAALAPGGRWLADRGGAGVKAGEQAAVDPGACTRAGSPQGEPMQSSTCVGANAEPTVCCAMALDVGLSPVDRTLRVETLATIRDGSPGRLREPPSRCAGRRIEVSLMVTAKLWVIDLGLSVAVGGVGIGAAWWMRRFTLLSARNLYPGAAVGVLGIAVPALLGWRVGSNSCCSRSRRRGSRRRASAIAGDSQIWAPARSCARTSSRAGGSGSRVGACRRASGGICARRESSSTSDSGRLAGLRVDDAQSAQRGARLPFGAGQHVVVFGATGAGKTTTARRLIAARTLAQHSALLVLDQKGDAEDVRRCERLAAAAGVPFILFDSQDPDTDRWQPLWGTPDGVAARAVEPIKQSEPYYYDVLRRHLDIVCKVLHAADRWPPSIPMLVDACQPLRYPAMLAIADAARRRARATLMRRASEHGRYVTSRRGTDDLSGGCVPPRGRARARQPPDGHPAADTRRRDGRRPLGRGAPAARGRDVAHPRRHDARRGGCALGARARRPPRRRRAGRRALDAAARRVRGGDQDGRTARHGDPATWSVSRRPGRRHHPVGGRHRGADWPDQDCWRA